MRLFILIFLISFIHTNVSNDSLAVLIEKGNTEILDVVKYTDPLADKIGGIEINPLYSMLYSTGDRFCFSGTSSFFPKGQNAEIAFPFSRKKIDNETSINIDAQYRYFLGEFRKGIYIMGGFRYSSYDDGIGIMANPLQWLSNDGDYDKSGISFGVGYRVFGRKGLYWGCSIYLGKYYWGSDNGPSGFMNLEFLKFGKTF